MGKQIQNQSEEKPLKVHKQSKANRFEKFTESESTEKTTWKSEAVVYIGHLPHGFYEQQLKSYFTQYGEVLAVKVARSRTTARSRGYGFVQFKYPEIANIVAGTINGYLLLGKVLISHTLSPKIRNPFTYSTAGKYKFINWKRLFRKQLNQEKSQEEIVKVVTGLLSNEEKRRARLKQLGIEYNFPGFASEVKVQKSQKSK